MGKPRSVVGQSETKPDVAGTKVWVKQQNGPPRPGEVIVQGRDSTVAVMFPGEEKWVMVPVQQCYLREN